MSASKQITSKTSSAPMPLTTNNIHAQLQNLAHEGTEESMNKIMDFILKESNKELKEYANIAYDEAQYFYYGPNNQKEEREFMLAKMIWERDKYFWKMMSEADDLQQEVREFELNKKVHQKLMQKNLSKETMDDWQYRCMDDFIFGERNRLCELEQNIKYEGAWLEEARKMIIMKKYQNVPEEVFEHLHFAGNSGAFWHDDFSSSPEEKQRPYCGSWKTEPVYNCCCGGQNEMMDSIDYSEIDDIPF